MNHTSKIALAIVGLGLATQACASITFYEREGFGGRSFATARPIGNFERAGFNDRASSVIVTGERWEVCEDSRFAGRCVVLRPGQYASLAAMGLNDRISSVRTVNRQARFDEGRYAPAPVVAYDYRRRNKERLFEAEVTSVRAVLGPEEQRCWVEREQVGGAANMPGMLMGAVIGGILGHQVGSGRGNDVATGGGALVGAAIGGHVGRNGHPQSQAVQRCASVPSNAAPHHWDVTYRFRGQEHRMQTAQPPGSTILVNAQGEPRA